jgi:hypothetical protein
MNPLYKRMWKILIIKAQVLQSDAQTSNHGSDHLPIECPYASYLSSLNISFSIHKKETITENN